MLHYLVLLPYFQVRWILSRLTLTSQGKEDGPRTVKPTNSFGVCRMFSKLEGNDASVGCS